MANDFMFGSFVWSGKLYGGFIWNRAWGVWGTKVILPNSKNQILQVSGWDGGFLAFQRCVIKWWIGCHNAKLRWFDDGRGE